MRRGRQEKSITLPGISGQDTISGLTETDYLFWNGRMIDKTNIISAVMERLQNLEVGHYLDVRTYKRNRCVFFVKKGEDDYLVIENGYFQERFENVPLKKIKKLFKTLLKKEFPRSTKIRVYVMGEFDEQQAMDTQRKTL